MSAKMHWDDCPYRCNSDGKVLDPNIGKLVPCPHCSNVRKTLLAKGMAVEETTQQEVKLNTILGVESAYLSHMFVYDSVIPESESVFLEGSSLDSQKEAAEELYHSFVLGSKPKSSICFGISIKGRIDLFVYPMLAKAYMSGLSVARCISCSEFSRLQLRMDESIDSFLNSDVVVMVINDGCTNGDLAAAKGLMQSRALKGNPTIFVTTWTVEACSGLLGGYKDNPSMFMATPSFVGYKKSSGTHSSYINNILGERNGYAKSNTGVSISDL